VRTEFTARLLGSSGRRPLKHVQLARRNDLLLRQVCCRQYCELPSYLRVESCSGLSTPGGLPAVYKAHNSRLILMGNRPEVLIRKVEEEEEEEEEEES
jgi:hypothetical protein